MKAMGIFISFIAILIIGFYAIGFSSTIDAPSNTTDAGKQYENLSQATGLASSGIQGSMLLLIAGMLLSAAGFMYFSFNKGRK